VDRTERGLRQRVVASLGKLAGLDQEERHGWEEIECLLERQRPPRQLKLGTDEQTLGMSGPLWAEVDLSGVRVERVRDFGEVYLALSLWRRLGLDELLAGLIEPGRETVECEQVACPLRLARFSAHKSELEVTERWYADMCASAWSWTPKGLPLAYEVFVGNRAEVTSVEEIVEAMQRQHGCAKSSSGCWANSKQLTAACASVPVAMPERSNGASAAGWAANTGAETMVEVTVMRDARDVLPAWKPGQEA
jgi:hypothetical protein